MLRDLYFGRIRFLSMPHFWIANTHLHSKRGSLRPSGESNMVRGRKACRTSSGFPISDTYSQSLEVLP